MNELVLRFINLNISASWLILAVLILRFVLKKTPQWVNVLLWGIVAIRLLFPFSIESQFSLIPNIEVINPAILSEDPALQEDAPVDNPTIDPGKQEADAPAIPGQDIGATTDQEMQDADATTAPEKSINSTKIFLRVFLIIWGLGVILMLAYTTVSHYRLRRKVATAIRLIDNIFQSENVDFPFVFGFIKPKIYLPFNVDCLDLDHVVAHEVSHIRRKDHWWKPLGFLLLVFNWVNPLMWLAYVLLCRDIELACDENVIRKLDCEQRADYAQALVACSVKRHTISTYPLAFGEINVKDRVRSILHYRKPTFWIILMSILMCIAMCVFFLTDPKQDSFRLGIMVPAGSREAVVYADEELSPLNDRITVSFIDPLEDAEVFLTPVVATTDASYDESIHLTSGTSAEMNADKGSWFKIGVAMQNNTNKDRIVYIHVKNVEIRTAEEAGSLIESQLLKIRDSYSKVDRENSSAGHISGKTENAGMSQNPQSGELIHVTHNETSPETDPENMPAITDPVHYPVTGGSVVFDPTTGSVTGYEGEIVSANIPEKINGVVVVSIGDEAFNDCSSLNSIRIPDSVTKIGNCAFAHCYNLSSVNIPEGVKAIADGTFISCPLTDITIPDSVTSIGHEAFTFCGALTSITIPDSVTTIASSAFYRSGLTGITIPEGVTSIGYGAFSWCDDFAGYRVDKNNPNYCSDENGVLFNKDKTALISAPESLEGNYVVPDGVTTIDEYAFSYCNGLTSVTLPDSVTTIDSNAFLFCFNLSNIIIPDSVTTIQDWAFNQCGLTDITIPDSVTFIGSNVFSACDSLTDIYFTGSEEQWGQIDMGENDFGDIVIHYNAAN